MIATIHGEDVRRIRAHWRGSEHLRTVEIGLEGGDVVLLDAFALRLITETSARLRDPVWHVLGLELPSRREGA